MTRFHCLRASRLAAAIGGSALVVGMAPAAQAAITEYTNKAAFEAALAPGAYTETQMHGKYPNYYNVITINEINNLLQDDFNYFDRANF